MGEKAFGIHHERIQGYAAQVADLVREGVEPGIVVGGGNIFRGLEGVGSGYDRVKGDQMGMLATVINSLALHSALEAEGVQARVYTAIRMEPFADYYVKEKAVASLEEGCVNIIAGGTGNPYFTTDTAAALRALEMNADVLLKGTRVDGVYSQDPEKNPGAHRYNTITYNEAIEKQLNVMDMTAFALCRDNQLPIIVFNINLPGRMRKVLHEDDVGTLVQ